MLSKKKAEDPTVALERVLAAAAMGPSGVESAPAVDEDGEPIDPSLLNLNNSTAFRGMGDEQRVLAYRQLCEALNGPNRCVLDGEKQKHDHIIIYY